MRKTNVVGTPYLCVISELTKGPVCHGETYVLMSERWRRTNARVDRVNRTIVLGC